MPFTPKQPIEKLPLADRKDIRDDYEPEKEECEKKIASALKLNKFTINLNPNKIWAYNIASWQTPGPVLACFARGFTEALESYVKAFGAEGIEAFNSAVPNSELTAGVDETGDDAPQISAKIKDGTFQILFNHEKLGHYATDLTKDDIVSAIDSIPRDGLTLEAQLSITKKWEADKDELTRDIAGMVGIPDLKLDPNFEENFIRARTAKKNDFNFAHNFGYSGTAYFTGLRYTLEQEKVKDDELIQEGIQEAIEKKIVKLRVVDKTKSGNFNGVALEDGILYLETTADQWGFAPNQVAERLIASL